MVDCDKCRKRSYCELDPNEKCGFFIFDTMTTLSKDCIHDMDEIVLNNLRIVDTDDLVTIVENGIYYPISIEDGIVCRGFLSKDKIREIFNMIQEDDN